MRHGIINRYGFCDALIVLGFLLVSAFAKAQTLNLSKQSSIKLSADRFHGVDDFDNAYYDKRNVFYKMPIANFTAGVYQEFYDVQLGDLTSVDLINPLRILLFYKDSQTIVLLDNRLNERLRIDLSVLQPYRYFDHAALAGEQRLWLYNNDANRVELYDYITKNTLVTSPVLENRANQMLTDYNFCHLLTSYGVVSYNSYGSRLASLEQPIAGLGSYDYEKLLLWGDGVVALYKFSSNYRMEEIVLNWDDEIPQQLQSLYLKNGKLYIYHHNRLDTYTTQ